MGIYDAFGIWLHSMKISSDSIASCTPNRESKPIRTPNSVKTANLNGMCGERRVGAKERCISVFEERAMHASIVRLYVKHSIVI